MDANELQTVIDEYLARMNNADGVAARAPLMEFLYWVRDKRRTTCSCGSLICAPY